MRKILSSTGVAAGAAALLMTATGTATAAPVSWSMPGGQGSTYGSVQFNNRSVGITGEVQSHISGCIQTTFQTYPGDGFETRTTCDYSTRGFNFTMSTDFPGGASWVQVTLVHINDNGTDEWLGARTMDRP
ncbi:hypothetical protein [Streptomyces sp. NBC_00576]|uniref:hypothetical protein n=1 Tax=Streptomyces sp. NBC_00576 TaxID=2903665 RepID=UPI002E80867A|nr:hypothetical protein [Streptomyces sp. NBC_00576]WUB74098.1 hypothetical protein OG734_30765 [Streptomyces sp. NBC_00576]